MKRSTKKAKVEAKVLDEVEPMNPKSDSPCGMGGCQHPRSMHEITEDGVCHLCPCTAFIGVE